MKYYLDITLLPDVEANLGFLWQKVYQQVHLGLVENKIADNESAIAVSFPDYGDKVFPLGDKLRLFSENKRQLEQLDIAKWLSRLTDYTHIKSIKPVPSTVDQYALFQRKQFKSNLLKEASRRAKYKNETLAKAMEHFKHYESKTTLAFINMTSLSMGKGTLENRGFKFFIKQGIFINSKAGKFNCYGLSKTATVPWF